MSWSISYVYHQVLVSTNHSEVESFQNTCSLIYSILLGGVGGCICLVGFIANVIAAVLLSKSTVGQIQVFVLQALSISDAVCLLVQFFNESWTHIVLMFMDPCAVTALNAYAWFLAYGIGIMNMFRTMGTWITVLISHQRYIVVCRPLQARLIITYFKVKLQVLCIVVYSSLVWIPRLFESELVDTQCPDGRMYKVAVPTDIYYNDIYKNVYKIAIMVIINKVLPLIIMLAQSCLMVRSMYQRNRRIHPNDRYLKPSHLLKEGSKEKIITKKLMTVVLVCTQHCG